MEAFLLGKDAMAVLPTASNFDDSHSFASIVVNVPLRSRIEDQLHSNDFGLKAVALEKNQQ